MAQVRCPNCREIQYVQIDKIYLKLFEQCWECDKNEVNLRLLSPSAFEERERVVLIVAQEINYVKS